MVEHKPPSPVVCFSVRHSALDQIKPSALIRYAGSMGYHFVENFGKNSGVYENDDGEDERSIIIPYSTFLGDYRSRVLDIINELSKRLSNCEPWRVADELYKMSAQEDG